MQEPQTREFLKRQLAGAKVDPLFRSRIDDQTASVRSEFAHTLSESLAARCDRVAKGVPITKLLLYLAALEGLLHRYGIRSDVPIVLPALRDGPGGRRLYARPHLDPNLPVKDVLQKLHQELAQARLHQNFDVEAFVDRYRMLQGGEAEALRQVGLTYSAVTDLDVDDVMVRFAVQDHTLSVQGPNAGLLGELLPRWPRQWANALQYILQNPEISFDEVSVLSDEDEQRLLSYQDGDLNKSSTTLDAWVQEQAGKRPGDTAVVFEDQHQTYGELVERAQGVARAIADRVGPESTVGLVLDRGLEIPSTMLGVLQAGAAYVPIDSRLPDARIRFILKDCGAVLAISNLGDASRHRQWGDIECLDAQELHRHSASGELSTGSHDASNAAVIIYTSGSTGVPKGVVLEHGALVAKLVSSAQGLDLSDELRIVLLAFLSTDMSAYQIFTPLCMGGALVIPSLDEQSDPMAFWRLVHRHRVNMINSVPSFMQAMLEQPPAILPEAPLDVAVGGDVVTPALVETVRQRLHPRRLINFYGPSEATIEVTHWVSHDLRLDGSFVPIGSPLPGVHLYLLDEQRRPVPEGVEGEIYLGGFSVARGYLGRPDLTEARFVPDTLRNGRMYRTGDQARWRTGGTLEFLGRADGQLKIRGHRIELGEIEHVLVQLPAVREAVVTVSEGLDGDRRLLAHVIGQEGAVDEQEVKSALGALLPDVMIPCRVVSVTDWPLTANGKIDRRALPPPPSESAAKKRPQTSLETQLRAIWEGVLDTGPIGVDERFVDLGGHSLKAMLLTSRIREELNSELRMREVFEHPTIESQAALLKNRPRVNLEAKGSKEVRKGPASWAQQGIWLQMKIAPATRAAYNIVEAYRFEGRVEAQRLQDAVTALVKRHPSLRTVFEEDAFGTLHQRVTDAKPEVHLRSAASASEILARVDTERQIPLDLAKAPFRVHILELSDDTMGLVVTVHHIAADGWSVRILFRDLMALYAHHDLPPLSTGYLDHTLTQRTKMNGASVEHHQAYYRKLLLPMVPPLRLWTDHPRPPAQSFRGSSWVFSLDDATSIAFQALAKDHGVTRFTVFLAAVFAWLYRHCDQRALVVGSPVHGRGESTFHDVTGLFVNTVVLRTDVDPEGSFSDLVKQTHAQMMSSHAHQDYPFERLVEDILTERRLGHHPLFDVLVEMQLDDPLADHTHPEFHARRVESFDPVSLYDLSFSMLERPGPLTFRLGYASDLFEAETIERFGHRLIRTLKAIVEAPETPVGQLTILPDAERRSLYEGATGVVPDGVEPATLVALLEDRAKDHADCPAVVDEAGALTFAQLNAASEEFADLIASSTRIESGQVIAVILGRHRRTVVGVLGALKTGAAYLPLDPDAPDERLKYILKEAEVAAVITEPSWMARVRALTEAPVFSVHQDALELGGHRRYRRPVNAHDLAYVMYTSGSTGRPKGVMVAHGPISTTVRWRASQYDFSSQDRVLNIPSLFFDSAVNDVFSTLVGGATLVMLPHEHRADVDRIAEALVSYKITHFMMVPTLYQLLLERHSEALSSLRQVVLIGERVTSTLAQAHRQRLPSVKLYNEYGPAEATVCTTVHRVVDVGEGVPIGHPIWNRIVDVLDRADDLAPYGVVGELVVSGPDLAQGYLADAELTAQRFGTHPLRPDARMYRTGDLGRRWPDGSLEFVGRVDDQVKIRGSRVEPGEVEAGLIEHSEVRAAAVIPFSNQNEVYLTAFVVPRRPEHRLSAQTLARFLSERLPSYMIPARFVLRDVLPTTATGKIDRRALAEQTKHPDSEALLSFETNAAILTEVEVRLAALWEEVLEVTKVAPDDSFFDLGGHSLSANRLASLISTREGVDFRVREIFEHQTLSAMAAVLETKVPSQSFEIRPVPSGPHHPLSSAQRRLYLATQSSPSPTAFNLINAFFAPEAFDAERLRRALVRVVERHVSLRTIFLVVAGEPRQRVLDDPQVLFDTMTTRGQETLHAAIHEVGLTRFSLENGPLFKLRLAQTEEGSVLIFGAHHLACDAWSIGVLINELRTVYDGNDRTLERVEIGPGDVAAHEQAWLKTKDAEAMRAYWTQILAGPLPGPPLAPDVPRSPVKNHRGSLRQVILPQEIAEGLLRVGREHDASLFMTLYALFAVALYRSGRQRDLLLGFPIAGRSQPQLASQIGCYVNALPLRLELKPHRPFDVLLRHVRCRCLEAYENQRYPFDRLLGDLGASRSPGRAPLFDVGLTWEDVFTAEGMTEVRFAPPEITMVNDFWLYGRRHEGGILLELGYDHDLYQDATMASLLQYIVETARKVAGGANPALTELAELTSDQQGTRYRL